MRAGSNEHVVAYPYPVKGHLTSAQAHWGPDGAIRRDDTAAESTSILSNTRQPAEDHVPPNTDGCGRAFLLALSGSLLFAIKIASQAYTCHDYGLAAKHNVLFAFYMCTPADLVAGILYSLVRYTC